MKQLDGFGDEPTVAFMVSDVYMWLQEVRELAGLCRQGDVWTEHLSFQGGVLH